MHLRRPVGEGQDSGRAGAPRRPHTVLRHVPPVQKFDGDRLDESIWSYRTNFWGRPAQWFAHPSDNTVEVKDGLLHMKVAKRPDGQFVSPQLQTGEILWDYPDNGTTNKFWWIGKREPSALHVPHD